MKDFVFASSDFLANIMARYASYEALYREEAQAQPSIPYSRFEEGMVSVYESILRYVGVMSQYLKESAIGELVMKVV